jgi:hypothetical protein
MEFVHSLSTKRGEKQIMTFRLKITLPQGAQFEAEGNEDFIQKEKENFLNLVNTSKQRDAKSQREQIIAWQDMVNIQDNVVVLKTKMPNMTPSQAILLILAIAQNILQINSYSALHLSKSLKKSGFLRGRIDRLIYPELKNGTALATGTKRNRAYQLTSQGVSKAFVIAQRMKQQNDPAAISQYLTRYASLAKN